MSLFILMFFFIYGGTHFYFFLKARAAFAFGAVVGVPLALFLLLMFLAPVIVRIAERHGFEAIAHTFAWVGYLWMGLLFFFFTCSIALDFYGLIIRVSGALLHRDSASFMLSPMVSFRMAAVYTLIAAAYGYYEAGNIRAEKLVVRTAKLPDAVPVLRIVQISDVHLGIIIREERLKQMLAVIRAANPDVLVATGDLVDGQINGLGGLVQLLRECRPRYGKFAITGNHEYYAGLAQGLDFMEKAGFRVLRGEAVSVAGILNIAGVDDPAGKPYGLSREVDERRLLAGVPADLFTLFLKHRPRFDQPPGRFDLMLSGHVHGGQIFPFGLLVRFFYPHMDGFHRLANGSALYVSRGTGTWGPPIRFLAPPEVTIIELVNSRSR